MADVRALVAFVERNTLMADFPERLCEVLGYTFKNEALLTQALRLGFNKDVGYERLEFLGDRVLGLTVAEMLFREFPKEKEGGLASRHAYLVSAPVLAQVAEQWGLSAYLIIPDTERPAINIHSVNILCDVCESVIAALYLDGGLAVAQKLIFKYWTPLLKSVEKPPLNAKTALQEWAQARAKPLPVYTVLEKTGPQHAPVFKVQVTVKGVPSVCGEGTSKHAAEQQAALTMLKEIGEK